MRKKMKAKVCLCGEGAVGKTSTIRKFVYDTFDDSYVTTIGTKVTKKVVNAEYPERDLQVEVKMLIWDIMGQRDFLDVLKTTYFYGAQGILAVCDMTRKETLDALETWIDAVKNITGEIPTIILGNKSDLVNEQEIAPEDLEAFSSKGGYSWYTSVLGVPCV